MHELIDRLPMQINYTHAVGQKMAQHYEVSEQGLPGHLGNHMLRVDIQFESKVSEDGKTKYDCWGVSKAFHCGEVNLLQGDILNFVCNKW